MSYVARRSVFNYDAIPPGYYFRAMQEGAAAQRFWHREKFAAIAQWLRSDSDVLDIGCGPGSFLYIASETLPGLRGEGVDISNSQIEFAQQEVATKAPGMHFRVIKEDGLPYENNTFDFATTIELLEHLHPYDAMKTAMEVRRILRKGGEWLITTPNYHSLWPVLEWILNKVSPVQYHDQHISKFVRNSLIKFIEAAGFEVLELKTIFVFSPFVSSCSQELAKKIMRMEQKLTIPGSLLLLRCQPIE